MQFIQDHIIKWKKLSLANILVRQPIYGEGEIFLEIDTSGPETEKEIEY